MALEATMVAKSDSELRDQVAGWREALRLRRVEAADIQTDCLALAREAARRATTWHAYEVQVAGALTLINGCIAELATGEGKTLVAALAALVFSLEGRGVHVATVNTYLAGRDYEFAKPIFDMAGLTIGLVPERGDQASKRAAYACDVTYGVGYEFGFDYLRDQLARIRRPQHGATKRLFEAMFDAEPSALDIVQRGLAFAIIDELDSVLIDEAGSPLVISEPAPKGKTENGPYHHADRLAAKLEEGFDYALEGRRPVLTPVGQNRIHDGEDIPWRELRRPWENYIVNALTARKIFNRDEHYIVRDDSVIIVDQFTGRAHEERSWNGGLHQAVNAKEGVPIQPELESAASITRQRYYALYDTVSGLTGTASESAAELREFFGLNVVPVPLHQPCVREILPDRVFATQSAALDAVALEVCDRHEKGQPVLVGTRTIRISDMVSERLTRLKISHRLLSAKEDKEENEIVAQAGEAGKVLIATNMAGRGTHIGLSEEAIALGGLHVIGVERNDSCRIDRQLIGRCARQGQPGSAQFFISAEDALAKLIAGRWRGNGEFAGAAAKAKKLRKAQAELEKRAYHSRRLATERDRWIDQTRNVLA